MLERIPLTCLGISAGNELSLAANRFAGPLKKQHMDHLFCRLLQDALTRERRSFRQERDKQKQQFLDLGRRRGGSGCCHVEGKVFKARSFLAKAGALGGSIFFSRALDTTSRIIFQSPGGHALRPCQLLLGPLHTWPVEPRGQTPNSSPEVKQKFIKIYYQCSFVRF